MKVSELAALAGVTVRSVRYYHQIGLLPVPAESGGIRRYGFDHLVRLQRIRWLADSGVPLRSIGPVLDEDQQVADATRATDADDTADTDATRAAADAGTPTLRRSLAELGSALDDLETRIAELQRQRERMRTLLATSREVGRLSPLPQYIHDYYDDLLAASADDPGALDLIRRERQLVELTVYRSGFPAPIDRLLQDLPAALNQQMTPLLVEVAALADLPPGPDALQRARETCERHVAVIAELDPDIFEESVAMAGDQRGSGTILDTDALRELFVQAYPSPVIHAYFDHGMTLLFPADSQPPHGQTQHGQPQDGQPQDTAPRETR